MIKKKNTALAFPLPSHYKKKMPIDTFKNPLESLKILNATKPNLILKKHTQKERKKKFLAIEGDHLTPWSLHDMTSFKPGDDIKYSTTLKYPMTKNIN